MKPRSHKSHDGVYTSKSSPLAAAFRKRGPEESSDEELRALLDEIAMLRAIADEEEDDGKA